MNHYYCYNCNKLLGKIPAPDKDKLYCCINLDCKYRNKHYFFLDENELIFRHNYKDYYNEDFYFELISDKRTNKTMLYNHNTCDYVNIILKLDYYIEYPLLDQINFYENKIKSLLKLIIFS